AFTHRAQARPAPEVGDDHAPFGDLGRDLGNDRRDVLVREAVEAVALDPGAAELARERYQLGDGRLTPVERGGEAGARGNAGSKQATCGTSGNRSVTASIAARLCG